MSILKTNYKVTQNGQLTLEGLPFKTGEKLKIVIYGENNEAKWKEIYLKKILSTSVWSEEQILLIENAGKDLNKWQIPE